MTLTRVARWLALSLAAGAAWIGLSAPAQAIPVFARQTGHNCQACHISFPELTPYGREFKLNGYTFGEAQPFPLAFAIMASKTELSDNTNHADGTKVCDQCGNFHLDQGSVFFGGRITDNVGVFGQWSWSQGAGGTGPTSSAQDNTEFRFVHRFIPEGGLEPEAVVGIDINNNLTMQDVWNTVPAWRFPWFPQSQGGFGPVAAPAIDGMFGQRAVGIGAYAWVHKTWYAELSAVRKPWGPFSWLVNGSGNTPTAVSQPSDVIDGIAPYGRFAYSQDWGYNSLEVGFFGLHARTNWDALSNSPLGAPGDEITPGNAKSTYNDWGIDAQYQFNKNEPYIVSAAASYIHETADITPLQLNGLSSNTSNQIKEFNIKGTVYYDRTYGLSVGYTHLAGTADPILYGQGGAGGSGSGSPDSNYWTIEANYVPLQDMRFFLSYTAFTKLNGGSGNFDGLGNNASGQNVLFAGIWFAY